jgi:hypothetical protein
MAFLYPSAVAFLNSNNVFSCPFVSLTGGTVTYSGNYKIHTFTSNDTVTVNCPGNVELLMVGGGGGGGNDFAPTSNTFWVTGGGGGAGGLIYTSSFALSAGNLSVTIGNGGAPGPLNSQTAGSNGGNTVFSTFTAFGGRGGNSINNTPPPNVSGSSGGMQGGVCGIVRFGATCASCIFVPANGVQPNGYANDGGYYWDCITRNGTHVLKWRGAGGGGAGGDGNQTAGGAGLTYTISGASTIYVKGGDALTGTSNTKPANLGYGGDGGYDSTSITSNATSGSSGVMILKYQYQ